MDFQDFYNFIRENDVEFVDFRFTDMKGIWHHISFVASKVTDSLLSKGISFDGSSINGWKPINKSDMVIIPDLSNVILDPFTAQNTVIVFCNIFDPETNEYYHLDPRFIAKKAEEYLAKTDIADKAYFGPELEFFIFDDIRFKVDPHNCFYKIDGEEANFNSSTEYKAGNLGYRPGIKGGYFPVQPIDSLNDIRAEIVTMLKNTGLSPVLHHHEVAPLQCEVGFEFDTLLKTADNVQIYKYVVRNVANSYGKSATFMPKPIFGDNGSGMHIHQSLWNTDQTLFAGEEYGGLSETALYYIGGIIKHAKALSAFTNPTTNSYKRLVSGYEAPTYLAYSEFNRSAAIRIPYTNTTNAKRIETRFPDPTANSYLAFAAMLMAGLDGINNKIHPGEATEKNLYNLSKDEQANIPNLCGSLSEALISLSNDRGFLKIDNVFTDDFIDAYINLKLKELEEVNKIPHPCEFALYYNM
ncbi:MAG: type I glutamate--ammonia ligase [Alphaproteobacteria bacterium]